MIKLVNKFYNGGIPKTQKEAEDILTSEGYTKGSTAYTRNLRTLFRTGKTEGKFNSNKEAATQSERRAKADVLNTIQKRKNDWGAKSNTEKLAFLEKYLDSSKTGNKIDAQSAKELQNILVDQGYDLSFKDKATGKMRTGYDAVDGRIGNATFDKLNQYYALLNNNDAYEKAYKREHGQDAIPTYNKVAGQSRENVKNVANKQYQYFSENPEMYAGLLYDKNAAAKTASYLNDDAMRSLSTNVLENYQSEDGMTLNIPELAYQGMLGSRGVELQRNWEEGNVRGATDRFARNSGHLIGETLGAGQRASGMIAHALAGGDLPYSEGGLQLVKRYNPVTRQIDWVPEGKAFTTVADVAGIENNAGRFVVNTLTDPLFLMSQAGTLKDLYGNLKTSIKLGSPHFKGVTPEGGNGQLVDLGKDMTKEEMKALERNGTITRVSDKSWANVGNRAGRHGSGGGKQYTKSTGTQANYVYNNGPALELPELNLVSFHTPYIAPYQMNGRDYELPNFVYSNPEGLSTYEYSEDPSTEGRKMIVNDFNGNTSSNATANTQNIWRQGPQVGNIGSYYGDLMSKNKNGGCLNLICKKYE